MIIVTFCTQGDDPFDKAGHREFKTGNVQPYLDIFHSNDEIYILIQNVMKTIITSKQHAFAEQAAG